MADLGRGLQFENALYLFHFSVIEVSQTGLNSGDNHVPYEQYEASVLSKKLSSIIWYFIFFLPTYFILNQCLTQPKKTWTRSLKTGSVYQEVKITGIFFPISRIPQYNVSSHPLYKSA